MMPAQERNAQTALDVLTQLASGTVDRTMFTPDASWWTNMGQAYPLEEFIGLLATAHTATIGGVVIDPGLVIEADNSIVIEATSNIPLVDGGLYANRYLFLIHFHDGLIREIREYNDTAHVKEAFHLGG